MTSRYYLFPEDEEDPLRISHRVVDGLVRGTDFLPDYAGTRQRILSAVIELEDGKPTELLGIQGSIWVFDGEGGIRTGLHQAMALGMDALPTISRQSGTVVALHPHKSKRRLEQEFRWEPQKADIDLVIADIWPKKRADRLKSVAGVAKRKPPLTWDAKQAITEISADFWKISHAIEELKEPSQKSFGHEARKRSKLDPEFPHLYRAIADMSDWHLEVQKRKRTGKGVWFAVVEVLVWRDSVGEAVERFFEKHNDRDSAVLAARRMLAEHAHKFNDNTTVEAELLTDMEWEQRAYPE
jgi:hypothetical protein